MDLKNKIALITGGGSGIGLAIARRLAREGIHTVLASRRRELVATAAATLTRETGATSIGIAVDVRSKASVQTMLTEVRKTFQTVDILINNSGIGTGALAVDLAEEEWDRVMETNLKGAFLMTQAVLPAMIAQKSGHIINVSSQAGKHGYANATVYCASKFGLIGFAQALQAEVREHGIKVSNLLPALVQVPPPENESDLRADVLQTEDLAEAALYMLRQPARVKIEDLGLYHI